MAIDTGKHGGRATADSEASNLVMSLREVLGSRILATVTSVDDQALAAWAKGEDEPPFDVTSRLRTVREIVELLLEVETPPIIRSWFAGSNYALGNRAPAVVAAENPHAVLRAALAFRAYG